MKKNYREAVKLCHPDILAGDSKDEGKETFLRLQKAFQNHDAGEVKRILHALKQGVPLSEASETMSDLEMLRDEVARLRILIQEAREKLDEIKGSESWVTISELDDWDAYFEEKREQLLDEIERFKQEEMG